MKQIFLIFTVFFLLTYGVLILFQPFAIAQTKQQLCAQYSQSREIYECCMTHTLDNFEECFTQTQDSPDNGLPDVPDVGPEACAWRQPNGERCDEETQYCAEGCPPRKGTPNDKDQKTPSPSPEQKDSEEGPITKRFAGLSQYALPITSKTIVDFDGNALSPEDVLRAGVSEDVPFVQFEFDFANVKKGKPVNAIFSAGLPEALPLQSIIFTPSEDIDEGTLTVSIIDGARPELLGQGAPGAPDYARPEVLILPKQYELKDYIRIDAKIDRRGSEEYVWDGYETAPISEALFKMVTSLIPKKDGFNHPETEVVLLHLNKDNKWDPLVTEKGSECIFDKSLCTLTASSPGFSVFAIALKKPALSDQAAWATLVLFWVPGLVFFYYKFWRGIANKLKNSSKEDRVKILKELGFKRYVLIRGFFLGNSLAIFHTLLNTSGNKMSAARFVDFYFSDLIFGLIAGMILWYFATRKSQEKEALKQ